jgi:hypothetical protein
MDTSRETLVRAHALRREARATAKRAAAEWLELVGQCVAQFVIASGVGGADPVVVFRGDSTASPCADAPVIESLRNVVVVSDAGRRTHHPADDELWHAAVDIWAHLREAAERVYGEYIPAGLLVDVDAATVTCWESVHDPDGEPEPEFSFSLVHAAYSADSIDSVDAFLAAATSARPDRHGEAAPVRTQILMDRYRLTAPSRPDWHDETAR